MDAGRVVRNKPENYTLLSRKKYLFLSTKNTYNEYCTSKRYTLLFTDALIAAGRCLGNKTHEFLDSKKHKSIVKKNTD